MVKGEDYIRGDLWYHNGIPTRPIPKKIFDSIEDYSKYLRNLIVHSSSKDICFDEITKERDRVKNLMSKEESLFKPVLWREINDMEFPQDRWRIKDLLPKEGFVILSSISGERKTWCALEMAKSISEGLRFLGNDGFDTVSGKVLYIDAENSVSELQRRGRQLQFSVTNENLFLMNTNDLNLNDEDSVEKFLSYVAEKGIDVVFIDTLRACSGGIDESKAEAVRSFFNKLKPLKDKGVCVVFLDHFRKPSNFEGRVPKKEHLLGSQDKTASVEVLLMLSSDAGSDEIRFYQRKNRLGKEIPSFKIAMTDEVDENFVITKTTLLFDGEIDEQESKKDIAKEFIVEMLESGGRKTNEIILFLQKEKKIGSKNVREALKELCDKELIDSSKKGKENYYFIPTKAEIAEKSAEKDDF